MYLPPPDSQQRNYYPGGGRRQRISYRKTRCAKLLFESFDVGNAQQLALLVVIGVAVAGGGVGYHHGVADTSERAPKKTHQWPLIVRPSRTLITTSTLFWLKNQK